MKSAVAKHFIEIKCRNTLHFMDIARPACSNRREFGRLSQEHIYKL